MEGITIWTFIKADQFFPTYLPGVKNYKRKISGRSGRGNSLEFTGEEKKMIRKALRQLIIDHSKIPAL